MGEVPLYTPLLQNTGTGVARFALHQDQERDFFIDNLLVRIHFII